MTEPCGGAPDVLHHVEGITARRASPPLQGSTGPVSRLARISRSTVDSRQITFESESG